MDRKNVEILAPCGNWDSFLAAVENGADSVYLGGRSFSARQFAGNFDKETLGKAVEYAHVRGVNVYQTINILISDAEMIDAVNIVKEAYELGVDGIIIQDVGFAMLVKKLFPGLPLHASTQMTIYDLDGVRKLNELGFKRVVLARELSVCEIAHICKNTSMEVEVFIHGALCISYSGQCLMSSIIGGRSGNRGKCAQPCRLKYELCEALQRNCLSADLEKGYLLSPKDICSIEYIKDIINSGVKSLKIEGRMKNPEYVAVVTRIYKKYIDKICESIEDTDSPVDDIDLEDLRQIFNRGGFAKGYHFGKIGKDLMCYQKPKNWGVYIGNVLEYDRKIKLIKIKLEKEISIGDGIEVWNGEDESPGTVIIQIKINEKNVSSAKAGDVAYIGQLNGKIYAGLNVYKTQSKILNQSARETFIGKLSRKIMLNGKITIQKDSPVVFEIWDEDGNRLDFKGQNNPQIALNRPLTAQMVVAQLRKTGNTPFAFGEIEVIMDGDMSIPVSELNMIRREALEEMALKRIAPTLRKVPEDFDEKIKILSNFPGNSRIIREELKISAQFFKMNDDIDFAKLDLDRVYVPLSVISKPDCNIQINKFKDKGTEVFVHIPSITQGAYERILEKNINNLCDIGIDGLLVGNIGTVYKVHKASDLKIMGDLSLNVFNSFSIQEFLSMGLCGVTFSIELNLNQIKDTKKVIGADYEAIAYGRIPVMKSAYCPVGSLCGGLSENKKCSVPCTNKEFLLKDRMGMKFPVICDKIDCTASVLNSNVIFIPESLDKIKKSGVSMIRLNFTDESSEEIVELTNMYRNLCKNGVGNIELYGGLIQKVKSGGFTKGHYFRGV